MRDLLQGGVGKKMMIQEWISMMKLKENGRNVIVKVCIHFVCKNTALTVICSRLSDAKGQHRVWGHKYCQGNIVAVEVNVAYCRRCLGTRSAYNKDGTRSV